MAQSEPGASLERISFARESGERPTPNRARRFHVHLVELVILLVAAVLYQATVSIMRLPRSWAWSFVLVSAAVVSGVGFSLSLPRRRRIARLRRQARDRGCRTPEPGARLTCVGVPEELTEDGPLEDIPFEPWFFLGQPGAASPAVLALGGSGSLARWPCRFCCCSKLSPTSVWRIWLFLGGLAVGEAVVLLAEPAYIRLTPGRFDVLAYRPWRREADRNIDLRSQAGSRGHGLGAFAGEGSAMASARLELSLDGFVRPRRFARALLLAALSSLPGGAGLDGRTRRLTAQAHGLLRGT